MAIATTTHPFVGILKEPVKQQTVTQGVYKDRVLVPGPFNKDRVLVPVLMGLLITPISRKMHKS
jgi:hypothetical protein